MKRTTSGPPPLNPKNRTYIVLKYYSQLLREFDRGKIGYATIALIGQSCLGSVAVMVLLMAHLPAGTRTLALFWITSICMAYNAAVLAQARTTAVFNILLCSVVTCMLTIVVCIASF